MSDTAGERYAVVSCHVERPLDDDVWSRFSALQRRCPAGFPIAALMRPPDSAAGENAQTWLERAREASAHGPLGHHTHWTSPSHARPTGGATGDRVRAEGAHMLELGLSPTLFCGGGWYTDADVADACAELGYADCTPRATRPPYLGDGEPWAALSLPSRLRLPSGKFLGIRPTTHSLGDLGRALARRSLPHYVHVYFHDTDLLSRKRRAALRLAVEILSRRCETTDLDTLREASTGFPERNFALH
jgi:hypothetical protein